VLFHEDNTQSTIAEPYGLAVTEAPILEIMVLVPSRDIPSPPEELATEENFSVISPTLVRFVVPIVSRVETLLHTVSSLAS